jgi:hypothetical protein
VNDLFTREALGFIETADREPFFLYLNYTVPHAELRVPEDSLAPLRGTFPRRRSSTDGRREADGARRHLAGLSIAGDAEGGVRRDDRPHGSRRRHDRRAPAALGIERTRCDVRQRQRPTQEGGATPEYFKSSGGLAASSAICTRGASACRSSRAGQARFPPAA